MASSETGWAEKRKKGFVRYLLVDGIFYIGGPFAVMMQILGYFFLADADQRFSDYFVSSRTWITFLLTQPCSAALWEASNGGETKRLLQRKTRLKAGANMFELKRLSPQAVNSALEKARHYRLLNEPGAAESICLDILDVEPDNQDALVNIVLAMSDRFGKDYAVGDSRIQDYLARITDEYQRTYYTGITYERRAKAVLERDGVNAFELFHQAMDCFEKAEAMRPAGNDDAILRWNGCARIIVRNNLEPRDMGHDFLE